MRIAILNMSILRKSNTDHTSDVIDDSKPKPLIDDSSSIYEFRGLFPTLNPYVGIFNFSFWHLKKETERFFLYDL